MPVQIPNIKLNDGHEMPILGFGTANAYNQEIDQAISDAIDAGFRHFDGALYYANEVDVGHAFKRRISDGTVTRNDLFIVSKLWCSFMSPNLVESSLRKSLEDLQLDYLDLYVLHWPMAFEENLEMIPYDGNGKLICKDVDYVDTWKAMEVCLQKGLVRSIGVCNFNSQQIGRLLKHCTIKPVTNQVECHAYLNQKRLEEVCARDGIVLTAWGPLGRPGLNENPNDPVLLQDPTINALASKYKKTAAQILLRYLTMRGIAVIPKSSSKARIAENLASIEFGISGDDMVVIDDLNRDHRFLKNTWASHHPHYPFNIPF